MSILLQNQSIQARFLLLASAVLAALIEIKNHIHVVQSSLLFYYVFWTVVVFFFDFPSVCWVAHAVIEFVAGAGTGVVAAVGAVADACSFSFVYVIFYFLVGCVILC